MPARPPQVTKALAKGRRAGVKMVKPFKTAKNFTRERFYQDPTSNKSVTRTNVRQSGASPDVQAMAAASDENKRQANMAGKMRQQMLNTRKTNQFRAEQRRTAMRNRVRGGVRKGGAIGAGLGIAQALAENQRISEPAINIAKSQTRTQGAPSPMIPGNREQIIGQRQGRMFDQLGRATSAQSVMPPKKGVMSKGSAGKTSTAKAGPSRAPITKALGIKK
jgi:hypothetical protein